jgi:DNA-binding transcriptional LysR family regulator
MPKKVTWQQLEKKKNLISITRDSSVGQLIDKTWWQLHGRPYLPEIECHHWTSVLAMTKALEGMCIAPSHAAQSHIYPELERIEIVKPVVRRTISIAYLRNHELSPAAKAFLVQVAQIEIA